jgi:uncharacterized protein (DUF302 family)
VTQASEEVVMQAIIKIIFFKIFLAATLLTSSSIVFAGGEAPPSPVYTKVIEGVDYAQTLATLKDVIAGKGISLSHTLPPAEMLARTGPAYGITEQVLKHGEMIEFCSAKISHQLIQANFENITLCPFSISIYVLNADPDNVRLTFRKPYVLNDASKQPVEEMTKLLMDIIQETSEW